MKAQFVHFLYSETLNPFAEWLNAYNPHMLSDAKDFCPCSLKINNLSTALKSIDFTKAANGDGKMKQEDRSRGTA